MFMPVLLLVVFVATTILAMSLRRPIKFEDAPVRYGVSERTFRNYVAKGYFPAYRMPGVRGLVLDLDEVEEAMRRLPARRGKAGRSSYGLNAKIVSIPQQALLVDPQPIPADGQGQDR